VVFSVNAEDENIFEMGAGIVGVHPGEHELRGSCVQRSQRCQHGKKNQDGLSPQVSSHSCSEIESPSVHNITNAHPLAASAATLGCQRVLSIPANCQGKVVNPSECF